MVKETAKLNIVGQIVGYIKIATYVVKGHKWLIIRWEHTGSNRGPSAFKKESRLFCLFLNLKEYKRIVHNRLIF
jgi:hypothetical protein